MPSTFTGANRQIFLADVDKSSGVDETLRGSACHVAHPEEASVLCDARDSVHTPETKKPSARLGSEWVLSPHSSNNTDLGGLRNRYGFCWSVHQLIRRV
uniref:Uncharacterized protein n=1 Tax=Pseudomonas phage PACT201 TaxID=3230130 RepID=A0AAU8GW49_9VIRU